MARRAVFSLLPVAVMATAYAQAPNVCDQAGESPDVVVTSIPDASSYGSAGGISAFAIGTAARICFVSFDASAPPGSYPVYFAPGT